MEAEYISSGYAGAGFPNLALLGSQTRERLVGMLGLCPGRDATSAGTDSGTSHYGLGVDVYTHFTSPIRRYADVVVHRQLWAALCQSVAGAGGAPATGAPEPRAVASVPDSLVPSIFALHVNARAAPPPTVPTDDSVFPKLGVTAAASGSEAASMSTGPPPVGVDGAVRPRRGGGWGVPSKAKVTDSGTAVCSANTAAMNGGEGVAETSHDSSNAHGPGGPLTLTEGTVSTPSSLPTAPVVPSRGGWGVPGARRLSSTATTGALTVADSTAKTETVTLPLPSPSSPGGVAAEPCRQPFSPKQLAELCQRLNDRNRAAKIAGWETEALYTALYFAAHPEVATGVVVGLRANGMFVFVPKYGIKVRAARATHTLLPASPLLVIL